MSRRFLTLAPLGVLLLLQAAAADPSVVISEIMYHPADPGELLEFVELHNPEAPRVHLAGWRLEGDVYIEFAPGTFLAPGAYLVVARAPVHLRQVYALRHTPPAFAGRLRNSGGRLRLVNPAGITACEVRYRDNHPWPVAADGTGHSLSLIDPLFDPSEPASWTISPTTGGTPGQPNGFGAIPGLRTFSVPIPLRINELRAGPDGFLELFNASDTAFDLKGYHLTDSFRTLTRYRFPDGVSVPPRGHLVLNQDVFDDAFTFKAPDAQYALTTPEGNRVIDAVKATGLDTAPITGRLPDGVGPFVPLDEATAGAANTRAPPPPLVISELMYNPISGDDRDEFIELHNRGDTPVALEGFTFSSGVGFTFPAGPRIAPRAYIVVAKDPARIASRYDLSRSLVFGPYTGVLSNSGETVRLDDPAGRCVNEVTYGDAEPWTRWPDGLGSSLELIDTAADNTLAAAWDASDDRAKAQWHTFTDKGIHREFLGTNVPEFQFMLLEAGECLIDNIVLASQDGRALQEGFERGDLGWTALGTHERSGVTTEDSRSGRRCYRIVAEGRGDPRHNYVSVTLPRDLVPDKQYYLSFRAKWQRGSVQLLTRTVGQGVSKVHILRPPRNLGTPGARNSVAVPSAAPFVGVPDQSPIAPTVEQPVNLTVRIDCPRPVASAQVRYRRDGDAAFQSADLRRTADAWLGAIPPQPRGIVEFYIEAQDAEGRKGFFPREAPERSALYLSGMTHHERLPTYHMLVSGPNWQLLSQRPRLSNSLIDATLVYGNTAIFHSVRFRPRGSPYTRTTHRNFNWRLRFGNEGLGGRRTLTLDGQKQDNTRQRERVVHWLLSQVRVPSLRQRYVFFNIFGREEGIFEDKERVDGDFVDRWFPGDGLGHLHKIDDYFELLSNRGNEERRIEAFFQYRGNDPEQYRWNFPPRASGILEDFTPFLKFVAFVDPKVTSTRDFTLKADSVINMDQWLRTFAVRTVVDDWDTMGRNRGKNAYVYRSPGDAGLWHLLVWDSDLTFGNARSPLFSDKFPSFRRMLEVDRFRRDFLSIVAHLLNGPFTVESLQPILADTSAASGGNASSILGFVNQRRAFLLEQIPRGPDFSVQNVTRRSSRGTPDRLLAAGTAPVMAAGFLLDGRPGNSTFIDASRWTAEFPVGPEGGTMTLTAIDAGGNPLAAKEIKVSARSGAVALPVKPVPDPEPAPPPPREPVPTFVLRMGTNIDGAELAGGPAGPTINEPAAPAGELAQSDPVEEDPSLLLNVDQQPPDFGEDHAGVHHVAGAPARTFPGLPPLAAGPETRGDVSLGLGGPVDYGSILEPRTSPARTRDAESTDASRQPAPIAGGAITRVPEGSGPSFMWFVVGVLLFLGIIGAVVAGAYLQWRKLAGGAAIAAVRPGKSSQPAPAGVSSVSPSPAPRAVPFARSSPALRATPAAYPARAPHTPAAAHAHPVPPTPALSPTPPAAPVPAANARPSARAVLARTDVEAIKNDVASLTHADYRTALLAFERLAARGPAAIQPLLHFQSMPGNTPFGKIRKGPAGLHATEAAGSPPIPARAVVQLLIKVARTAEQ